MPGPDEEPSLFRFWSTMSYVYGVATLELIVHWASIIVECLLKKYEYWIISRTTVETTSWCEGDNVVAEVSYEWCDHAPS